MKSQITTLSVYGLEDLITGKVPTYTAWTNDPTDGGNITDGNIGTSCTTGDKVAGAGYDLSYLEWNLGTFYNVFITGYGLSVVSAGVALLYVYFWDGTVWRRTDVATSKGVNPVFATGGAICSKIRIAIFSTAAATITPDIREFHVWRLK